MFGSMQSAAQGPQPLIGDTFIQLQARDILPQSKEQVAVLEDIAAARIVPMLRAGAVAIAAAVTALAVSA
jgi:hypothetical protein